MPKAKRIRVIRDGNPVPASDRPLSIVGTKRWRETVPQHLQQPLAQALRAMEDNNLPEALKWFGACADIEPFSKPVLYFGGQVAAQGYFTLRGQDPNHPNLPEWRGIAETLVRAAFEVAPDDAVACHNLGRFLQDAGDDAEAIPVYRHALLLDEKQVETWGNLGTALYQLGRVEEAWECWRQATALPADKASARLAQSYIWLRQGRYTEGWGAYNDRWRDLEFQRGYGRFKDLGPKHWRGGPLPKRHALYVHGEQGLGDHVQFARYVAELQRQGYTIAALETRAVLKRWMEASFPGLAIHVRDTHPLPEYTHHVSTLDLPGILGTTVETIPAPMPPTFRDSTNEDIKTLMRRVAGDTSIRVGIAWEGAKGNPADSIRSIPHEALRHLADIPNVTWVALQFAPDAPMVGRAWLGKQFIDGADGCQDALDTAAVMRGLDLVVTVDTLTAHLAGTLGVPTWVLHRFCREWRWLDQGEACPWYPSVRSLTVSTPGDWDGLLARVRVGIMERVPHG